MESWNGRIRTCVLPALLLFPTELRSNGTSYQIFTAMALHNHKIKQALSISLRRCIALSSDVWGFVRHRASFGLFPRADACPIQRSGCDTWPPIKVHSQGGKEKMKPFLPFSPWYTITFWKRTLRTKRTNFHFLSKFSMPPPWTSDIPSARCLRLPFFRVLPPPDSNWAPRTLYTW